MTFTAGANGNAFPQQSFTSTTAIATEGAAVDGLGNIYVASFSPALIAVFPPGSNGNTAPSYTIAGGNTGLIEPLGLAFDVSGNLYVADRGGAVEVFAPGASGNATPIATISGLNTGLINVEAFAIDGTGRIIVANEGTGCCSFDGSITVRDRSAGSERGRRRQRRRNLGFRPDRARTLQIRVGCQWGRRTTPDHPGSRHAAVRSPEDRHPLSAPAKLTLE